MGKFYAAYGSNLNKSQMFRRCPDAMPVDDARLNNYRLVFRRGYLTIEPAQGFYVPVGIWRISDADEKRLDMYEGFPRFYRKENVRVDAYGKMVDALVYIMNDGFPIQEPSAAYYGAVRQGYCDFGFAHGDYELLWMAMDYARRNGVKR